MPDHGAPGQAAELSLRLPTSGGYAIRAQVDIALEAGLRVLYQRGTQSRVGNPAIMPL